MTLRIGILCSDPTADLWSSRFTSSPELEGIES